MLAAVASRFAFITLVPFSPLPFAFFVFGLLDVVAVTDVADFAAAVVDTDAGDVLFCSFLTEFLFFDVAFFLVDFALFSEEFLLLFVVGVAPDGTGWEGVGRVIFDDDG